MVALRYVDNSFKRVVVCASGDDKLAARCGCTLTSYVHTYHKLQLRPYGQLFASSRFLSTRDRSLCAVFMPKSHYETLHKEEVFWRDRYHFFKSKGYILRPRYHPEWKASWRFEANPIVAFFEDSITQWVRHSSPISEKLLTEWACNRKVLFLMPQSKARMEKTCSLKESTPPLTLMRSRSLRV